MARRERSRHHAVSVHDERDAAPYDHPWLVRIRTYFSKDVWRPSLSELDPLRALYYKTARILYLACAGFQEDKCFFRASALTYITVLSLVPLLAFAFSVTKGLGAYEDLMVTVRRWLDGWLATEAAQPSEGGNPFRNSLDIVLEFVNTTDVTKLGAAGFVILLFAVVQLLGTIERSFNDIWGVQRQ